MELGSIIWIVIIGGMFYLMMKGGGCCGGHSKKEGHDHSGKGKTNEYGSGIDHDYKKGCH
jgi:hypothetical protein